MFGRELRSRLDACGVLTLSIETVEIAPPDPDEVIVQVEAAPINPTDLALLLGPADVSSLQERGAQDPPALMFNVPSARLLRFGHRLDRSLPVGTEGAGTVVAAGVNNAGMMGMSVAFMGGGAYADFRRLSRGDVTVLPDGASAADGAAMFINPMTALGFVETAHSEGHRAIVHTAAASNLGLMLQRVCRADGIPLVNVVRSERQIDALRAAGATHVLNSGEAGFAADLARAIDEVGATIAFDAIGGGTLGGTILKTMEQVASGKLDEPSRYGSDTFKHLYLYGALDPAPTVLNRLAFGWEWSVSGWLLFAFLRRAGPGVEERLRRRVRDELTTTFASRYSRVIGLAEALRPETLRAYHRMATGEKFLIDPTRG